MGDHDDRTERSRWPECAVSAAGGSGAYALSLPRLRVTEPTPVGYVTEEDNEGAVYEHFDAFSDGQARHLPIFRAHAVA